MYKQTKAPKEVKKKHPTPILNSIFLFLYSYIAFTFSSEKMSSHRVRC